VIFDLSGASPRQIEDRRSGEYSNATCGEDYSASDTLMWWKSAVNRSFFLSLAAFRTRSSDWDMRSRPCVRCMRCCSAFPLVPGLGSTGSATGCPALFVGFTATMPKSDFSTSPCRASAATAPRLPAADHLSQGRYGQHGDLPVPVQGTSIRARVCDNAGSNARSQ